MIHRLFPRALAMLLIATGLPACSSFDSLAKNPNCVTRISGKTTFGGGIPVGEGRFSAVCNGPQKASEPPPPAPPAPDDVKPPT